MITVGAILSVILLVVVFVILWAIAQKLAAALNIPPLWVQIAYLVLLLIAVIWAFGLFGISQPLVR